MKTVEIRRHSVTDADGNVSPEGVALAQRAKATLRCFRPSSDSPTICRQGAPPSSFPMAAASNGLCCWPSAVSLTFGPWAVH